MSDLVKVLVTGANGLVGSAICKQLKSIDKFEIIPVCRSDCDLVDYASVKEYFDRKKPDLVFHCAAKVGGIGANKNFPVDFLVENIEIQNNVLKASHKVGVDRLIFFASNAIYPEHIQHPIKEVDMLTGRPEATVRPYALAKLSGIELCSAFNQQYGTKFLSLIPINLYGPNDNFHPENSHVLPALIRKFHEAKIAGEKEVVVWGSGKQRREFMCSLDLAHIACEIMSLSDEKFIFLCNEYPPVINIGAGNDISIKELAELIAVEVGYSGKIVFDATQPEGIRKKETSIEKLKRLGLSANIPLNDGVKIIYEYFKSNVYKK